MTAEAFILVEAKAEKLKSIVTELRKVEGIKSVNAVTGPYDIIAVVQGPDLTAVGNLVTSKIRTTTGVIKTVTCLTIELN
ncbi:Lrp/AsnC family transcriptional regulator [Chloroflexota bacterium]